MFSIKFILVLIASATISITSAVEEKINVLVLYESLCPDSIRFMKNQLGPNYDSLKDVIDVTLVPFGKSESVNDGAQFFCQHGPAECEGNRMQSCVLHETTDQETQVKFVVCQMSGQYESSNQYCAQSVGLSGDIKECMNTELGTLLQLEAEKITQLYAPSFVPTIIYDGKFDQQLQDNSLTNFKGVVCSLLQKRGSIAFNTVC
ncbi:GILT-like protein 1 [Episyrphus balteatus]|uniref:GILT-like protein 1 n=1 Tax=Episyrphus balteatus TaxID=286459 RepID=UPI0024866AA1|nr:GILT-like protein 1 [Episyrphus balteatus]